jgi:hypothetical protein
LAEPQIQSRLSKTSLTADKLRWAGKLPSPRFRVTAIVVGAGSDAYRHLHSQHPLAWTHETIPSFQESVPESRS